MLTSTNALSYYSNQSTAEPLKSSTQVRNVH